MNNESSVQGNRIVFKEFFINLLEKIFTRNGFGKFSLVVMVLTIAVISIAISQQTNLFSHASLSLFTTCTPIPKGLTPQQLQELSAAKKVVWCTTGAPTIASQSFEVASNTTQIAALGDSITAGFYNCTSTANPATCPLQSNSYVYLYATSVLQNGESYFNFGYAGTTAACVGQCPTTDAPNTDPNVFKNSYIQNVEKLPNNESDIQVQANMENRTAPGIVRATLGEFDNFSNTNVIIAWGRNDVDSPLISLASYEQALEQIAQHIQKNSTNTLTFLTISPMDQAGWLKYYAPRHEFDDRIANVSYPKELDAFFSAQEWKVAYATHSYIAPLSEYLWQQFPPDYLSIDHIHPSASGYQLIANVLRNERGYVTKTIVTQSVGTKYTIHASSPTYGEIVTEKNGSFYYAEPFYADSKTPYISMVMSDQTSIYGNNPITVSNSIATNTEVAAFTINGHTVDSVTAYGKGWNWDVNSKLPWVGNGFDLTTVPRFVQGPCTGQSIGECRFDTRSEFLINGQEVESITAYGKYWNFDLNGNPWPTVTTSGNGNDLTSVPRYANGPCKGKTSGTCVFTSRKQILQANGKWIEEVNAYDKIWDWNQDGDLVAESSGGLAPAAPKVSNTPTISLDINHDGQVNALDYQYLRNCFGLTDTQSTGSCPNPAWADLNKDGVVNGIDYNIFLRLYTTQQNK